MYGAIFEELNVLSFELYSIQHVRVDVYGAIFEELNVLSFELYSIQHVRATALNLYSDVPFCVLLPVENKWKVLNHFPAWAITVFGFHHSQCFFLKQA